MFIDLPDLYIVIANVVGIPVVHFTIAWLTTQLPDRFFITKKPLHSERFNNPISPVYENIFHIKLWKDKLPDAGPWLNGFSKGSLKATDTPYLKTFVAETRRGEFSHWIQALVICCFVLWNPYPANLVIISYAILSNAPCILNQRFTRHRILKLLYKRFTT
ncbi:hypothetical protein OAI07_01750 [Akkermansiaceae bacterium]|nr:hypothetical protein [Akkermansiaceae bacterium]